MDMVKITLVKSMIGATPNQKATAKSLGLNKIGDSIVHKDDAVAASKILTALIDDAEDDGITDITLEVRVSNRPAIALYEGFGFESAGIRRGYYQNGEDALIMWRRKEEQ